MSVASSPLVSVVMPTYNHGRYIGRAIQSVLDQSYTNWELIVVDNCSVDKTREVISKFGCEKLTYLRVQNDGIIAISRNAGIRKSSGDIVAFLDSDDWWYTRKLEDAVAAHLAGADLVYHPLRLFDLETATLMRGRGQGKMHLRRLRPPVTPRLLLWGNTIPNSSVTVRKELLLAIGLLSEERWIRAAEDFDAWIRISALTDGFVMLPQCLGANGKSDSNISGDSLKMRLLDYGVRRYHFERGVTGNAGPFWWAWFRFRPQNFIRILVRQLLRTTNLQRRSIICAVFGTGLNDPVSD